MRRICSLWLPNLAIERWAGLSDAPHEALARPLVLTVEGRHGLLIHAVTPAAAARGARAGTRLTDARALDPALEAEAADVAGEAAWLRAAARWAGRWSPLVEVDGADGLRLDLSGVAQLFGGEAALLAQIELSFAARGFAARAAAAGTTGAAWALARFGPHLLLPREPGGGDIRVADDGGGSGRRRAPSVRFADSSPRCAPLWGAPKGCCPGERQELAALLAPLSVAALRLSPEANRTLIRLGLKTIGDLIGVPRTALARRFGKEDHPLDALDRALGRKPEPLTALPDDPPPRALLSFREPVTHPEAGAQALGPLVERLAAQLQARQIGARELRLVGYRIDGSLTEVGVATSIPTRAPDHLLRLLGGALERTGLDPGFGIDAIALEVRWWERLDCAQGGLAGEEQAGAEVAALVDRLSVKLGPEKVRRPVAVDSHLPERAAGWMAGVDPCSSPLRKEGFEGSRLLDRPEEIAVIYATPEGLPRRFVWRRKVHDIARAQGPRRVAPEWWRARSNARLRDYYKVEDSAGVRFWIFREGVAGDGRGGPPLWFVQGLFA